MKLAKVNSGVNYIEEVDLKYLGGGSPKTSLVELKHHYLGNFKLEHEIHLFQRDWTFTDGSIPNVSVNAILKKFYKNDWRGPFLARRAIRQDGTDNQPYRDISLADIGVAISHFKTSGLMDKPWDAMNEAEKDDFLSPRDPHKEAHILAAVATCAADRGLRGWGHFVTGAAYLDDPVFTFQAVISQISQHIGLPLAFRQLQKEVTFNSFDAMRYRPRSLPPRPFRSKKASGE